MPFCQKYVLTKWKFGSIFIFNGGNYEESN